MSIRDGNYYHFEFIVVCSSKNNIYIE